jgi:hypothetical protein
VSYNLVMTFGDESDPLDLTVQNQSLSHLSDADLSIMHGLLSLAMSRYHREIATRNPPSYPVQPF